jgi:hypothetical protein
MITICYNPHSVLAGMARFPDGALSAICHIKIFFRLAGATAYCFEYSKNKVSFRRKEHFFYQFRGKNWGYSQSP